MNYQVIARKWRPQTFGDVIGQTAATQTLKNAIVQNRIAHAYLFAGARGVGKTTTARILAKALNCTQGPTASPCNQCDSCREITAGNSIDVLEIDAASNRGIDEIRELRENVKYATARDRYKVFIIDEVHMLTTEAFNALLKTLEEPPPHVVFILATTELHKVPATILSRCQHFNFRTMTHREVLDQLRFVATQEQITISEPALSTLARASEGSMRDAQSLLDQVISFCGKEVEDDHVRNLLGIIPQEILEQFTTAIIDGNAKQAILLVDRLVESGRNLQQFVREMLSHFRNLLMAKIAGGDPQLIPLAPTDLARLREFAKSFSEEDLTRFFGILVATEGELKWSTQPRFHLEMGLMKIIQAKRLVPLEELLLGLEDLSKVEKAEEPSAKTVSRLSSSPISSRFAMGTAAKLQPQPQADPAFKPSPKGPAEELKNAISKRSPMLSSLMDHALDIRVEAKCVEIQFANHDRFYYEMMQSAENMEVIKELAASIAGHSQVVKVVLVNGQTEENTSDPEGAPPSSKKLRNPLLERVKNDSGVKTFLETFHGEITDVEELK